MKVGYFILIILGVIVIFGFLNYNQIPYEKVTNTLKTYCRGLSFEIKTTNTTGKNLIAEMKAGADLERIKTVKYLEIKPENKYTAFFDPKAGKTNGCDKEEVEEILKTSCTYFVILDLSNYKIGVLDYKPQLEYWLENPPKCGFGG